MPTSNPHRDERPLAEMGWTTLTSTPEHRTESPGFTAVDIDEAAMRNYRLGRRDGFRDRNEEVSALRRRLPDVWDEGYEAASGDATDAVAALFDRSIELAHELIDGEHNAADARRLGRELALSLVHAELLLRSVREVKPPHSLARGVVARLEDALRDHS